MRERKMLPAYQRLKTDENLQDGSKKAAFTIAFGNFSLMTVSLPLFSFIFCVAYSIIFFFEESVSTHCHVWNYLPSISAAIGAFQPQAFVWQTAIVLHFIPRLTVTWMYFNFYTQQIKRNRQNVANVAIFLNLIENICLLGLSLYNSTTYYDYHKVFFCTFIVTSELYMMLSYYLNKSARRNPNLDQREMKSLRLKRNLCIINIISILLATYFFIRHNDHCEGGIYTLFAFFEYIVVLTNMGFHLTSIYDFHNQHLIFDWTYGIRVHYQ
ncbi:unnamed protein product [Chironomus riparius]|uniref:CWH43-like N-terminal domain-containing protein n=1 Tax=Chironomus riparius TaxID=315576 RepID=A0A9N9WLD5_9DIPT|nr:unnamed protein product [Chironomus riparius]